MARAPKNRHGKFGWQLPIKPPTKTPDLFSTTNPFYDRQPEQLERGANLMPQPQPCTVKIPDWWKWGAPQDPRKVSSADPPAVPSSPFAPYKGTHLRSTRYLWGEQVPLPPPLPAWWKDDPSFNSNLNQTGFQLGPPLKPNLEPPRAWCQKQAAECPPDDPPLEPQLQKEESGRQQQQEGFQLDPHLKPLLRLWQHQQDEFWRQQQELQNFCWRQQQELQNFCWRQQQELQNLRLRQQGTFNEMSNTGLFPHGCV